ncbi:hypothetical protein Nepgr_026513 [Nepenthes gracilis]|uniref:RING-type E3 ubiquitin transferase n=1 Tax=Nepenthes gracilis TaxID=150966 RepID=A0AAD3T7X9_NEPGR|nr:hypothetical protein Nepgr_026513 [Nepenthes gracilis]
MDMQLHEKVYVAVGNDMDEGVLTLEWAIKKWATHPISIVILHADFNTSKDIVHTPFGKMPANAVSDEKLEILRKYEQEKIDKILSKYMAVCGKVKAEILKIEKYEEPIQKIIVELIMEYRITKLVMAMTFMRSSSWRSKSAISGSFYVHRNKPEFCDLYILCGGKLVLLKDENEEGLMEDEQGTMVAKLKQKGNFRGWLGRMLAHGRSPYGSPSLSPRGTDSPNSPNQWDTFAREIDEYFQQLLEENEDNNVEENGVLENSLGEPKMPDSIKNSAEKIEDVKIKMEEAQKTIQLKKHEAKIEVERQARATWAICLCNHRAEELEARTNDEIAMRTDLSRELEVTKDQIQEVVTYLLESKNRLKSLLELQSELSSKFQASSLAKLCAEAQLESAVKARAEVVGEIEELRKQRDILQRRIEFCKEKDAIGTATARMGEVVSCSPRDFKADDIRLATDNFSVRGRLKCGENWTSFYKGKISHTTVAIKMLNSDVEFSHEFFQAKVNLLLSIRHPNITGLIGFCSELKCFVFEYMHNGCLRDTLFSRRSRALQWHHRLHIAAQVCSSLSFLHLSEPQPIVHGGLNPSSILLDHHFVAKINAFELTQCYDELDLQSDVHAFGIILLQLLCGRNWAGLDQEEMMTDKRAILGALDDSAGDWPFDLAEEIIGIAMNCVSVCNSELHRGGLIMASVMKAVDNVRKKADDLMARREYEEEESNAPRMFLCPIFQEVMENPHVAADGFSYELEAIEEWLHMGNETSPVTNLKLSHKHLIPNHTLRSLIQDWRN